MIVSLDSLEAQDVSLAGGKASTLARLRAAGFPVPPGFVVVDADPDRAALQQAIASLEEISAAGGRFAVRSSGQAEDSSSASFAGQFETVLGVRGVEEIAAAVGCCFASFGGARARVYERGVGVREQGGAVLVQLLVEADAAGVAFSADPVTGARDCVVIDAAAGLGDAVVGGRVAPDGFVVRKGTLEIVDRRIAGEVPCLDDHAVGRIAALAERVEAHEDAPVDVEWAWQGGQVHLLQARPITAVPPSRSDPPADWVPELNTRIDPRFPLYSNGNVGEVLPGCVTPLTFSLFARSIERAFRDLTESLGSMPDVGPDPIVVGFFFHRVYLNASYFMTAADRSPGASRDTVYEDLIGPPPRRHPAWSAADLLPWHAWRGARIIRRYLRMQKGLDADVAACRAHYEALRATFTARDPAQWSPEELAEWLDANDPSLEPARVHVRASQLANSSFRMLRATTRRSLGDETGAIAAALVTGIGSVASAGPSAGLYDLAQQVQASPALAALFAAESDAARLLDRLSTEPVPEAAALRAALDLFVERFGHRGLREADLRGACWREQPSAIIAHVRQHLQPGSIAPAAIAERQQAIAAQARARALAALPAWRRALFDAGITAARRHIAAREEMKDLLLRFHDLTRRVVRESTERLAGHLATPDDIHFLLDGEAASALRGALTPEAVTGIVRRRRQEFRWCERVHVPKVQEGVARCTKAPETAPGAGVLVGIPVSPGLVEGTARVVLDPGRAALAAGEILVAPVTDVAWTPLFLRAAGLVVEVGGPLSHGSIVAREFGIPAVTGVAGATERIRTGDRLRIDGERGLVQKISA